MFDGTTIGAAAKAPAAAEARRRNCRRVREDLRDVFFTEGLSGDPARIRPLIMTQLAEQICEVKCAKQGGSPDSGSITAFVRFLLTELCRDDKRVGRSR